MITTAKSSGSLIVIVLVCINTKSAIDSPKKINSEITVILRLTIFSFFPAASLFANGTKTSGNTIISRPKKGTASSAFIILLTLSKHPTEISIAVNMATALIIAIKICLILNTVIILQGNLICPTR